MAGTDFDSFLESLEAVEPPLESPSVSSTDVNMFFGDHHDGVVANQGFMGDLWDFDDFINNFDLNESTSEKSPDDNHPLNFICIVRRCDFSASNWDEIVHHRKDVHSLETGRRSCYCSSCGKVFGEKCNRYRHVLAAHGGQGFYCQDCPWRLPFLRRDNYLRHRSTRHGDKSRHILQSCMHRPENYENLSRRIKPKAYSRFRFSVIQS
jgi:hypothetical protein